MKAKVDNLDLELVQGDIINQPDLKAIVNAANAELKIGGGVAGAIHRSAGPGLEEECEPLAPIQVGEAVITGGHELPNDYVVHTLGPVYGVDKPEAEFLEKSYKNSLEIADKKEIKSIGFPAISTGAFGYPIGKAAEISLEAIKNYAAKLNNLKLIRFILYSKADFEVYKEKANKILK